MGLQEAEKGTLFFFILPLSLFHPSFSFVGDPGSNWWFESPGLLVPDHPTSGTPLGQSRRSETGRKPGEVQNTDEDHVFHYCFLCISTGDPVVST